MPDLQTSGSRNIARYEKVYAESSFEPTQALMRKRVVLELLARWKPRRLLEIGCGTDPIFNHYRQADEVVVVEPGEDFAANAQQMAQQMHQVRVVEGFVEPLAEHGVLGQKCFDCVLVSGLLHEVADPGRLLDVTRGLVAAGGRVHVNVPNARSLHRLLAFEMGLIDDIHEISERQKALQQHTTFDMRALKALCVSKGFVVTDEGSFFVKPFTHGQMYLLQELGILDEGMLNGLMRLEKHLPGMGSEIFVNLTVPGE